MKPAEYEDIVRKISEHAFNRFGVDIDDPIKHNSKQNRKPGKSGYQHQIDVSFTRKDNGEVFLIECKYWKGKIYPEQILAFYGRIKDIEEKIGHHVNGVIATTNDLTDGVMTLSKWAGITSLKVNSIDDFIGQIGNLFFIKTSNATQSQFSEEVKLEYHPPSV